MHRHVRVHMHIHMHIRRWRARAVSRSLEKMDSATNGLVEAIRLSLDDFFLEPEPDAAKTIQAAPEYELLPSTQSRAREAKTLPQGNPRLRDDLGDICIYP